ncbi:MAG: deoxyribonuclease IV [Planctomycetota bacterium]
MPKLGSHMSIAGGYYKAVEAAAVAGCDCVQLFTKNSNQWAAKPITPQDAEAFAGELVQHRVSDPISHASYLINLASPNPDLREKSCGALATELHRAGQLGIRWVIFHPGAFTESTAEEGLDKIAAAMDGILIDTAECGAGLLLENTAGQGTNLGWNFAQLAAILDQLGHRERVGVCFDTCHAFAAGYDLSQPAGYDEMWSEFDEQVGLDRLQAIHLNDSKKGLGSRVDRHEHIGLGAIGLEGFRRLLNDSRLDRVPMYLETEKGHNEAGEDWDVVNLRTLRDLVG